MDHSIDQLAYRLVPGPVVLDSLHILASRQIHWSGWSVTFHVLGASHAVTLTRVDSTVTELLTCVPPADDPRCLIYLTRVPSSGCTSHVGLVCHVQLSVDDLDMSRCGQPVGDVLAHSFPPVAGVSPITRIEWQTGEGDLVIDTLHTYPEAGRAVKSRTQFSIEEDE